MRCIFVYQPVKKYDEMFCVLLKDFKKFKKKIASEYNTKIIANTDVYTRNLR